MKELCLVMLHFGAINMCDCCFSSSFENSIISHLSSGFWWPPTPPAIFASGRPDPSGSAPWTLLDSFRFPKRIKIELKILIPEPWIVAFVLPPDLWPSVRGSHSAPTPSCWFRSSPGFRTSAWTSTPPFRSPRPRNAEFLLGALQAFAPEENNVYCTVELLNWKWFASEYRFIFSRQLLPQQLGLPHGHLERADADVGLVKPLF